jgi:hypothetical protein
MERIRTFITLLAFITWPILSLAAEFTAQVVGVIDGDHAQRIRLKGIDCAEKGQGEASYIGRCLRQRSYAAHMARISTDEPSQMCF